MGIRNRRARAHSKTHIVSFTAAGVLGFLALLAITLTISLGALVESWLQDLPDYTSADAYLVAEPSQVYDAEGNTIASFYVQNRHSVTQQDVSPYVLKGTVDVEDERFYQHNGVDPIGIARAVVSQLLGRSEGASTITQQLVRNTVLSDEQFEKSIKRKVREAYIAIEMEKTYSKDQILMMYLNTIYYGHGAYGIEAASLTYFSKHANELTLAEAATLIGLPNSPSYYDPTVNPEGCVTRRNKVLDNMVRLGDITQEECDQAKATELELNLGNTNLDNEGTYPYWTNYVKGLLEGDFSQETIVQSGLRIYTTIDPSWQQAAEDSVAKMLEGTGNADINSSLVAIDPSTGYIKAMVGGRDYDTNQNNMATLTAKQPGSSFKMLALVAALQNGMSPDIQINCNSPITLTGGTRVQNFGNQSYGTLSLREATWKSSNTGYIQIGQAVGMEKVVATAKSMGISANLDPYASTVLGAQEVSALEMAEAYATLASGGVHRDPVAITRIEDRNGNVVYEHTDNPTQVIDAGVAKVAAEILQGVITNGTATGARNTLAIDQPVAGKTGTTDDADNLWFCAITPQAAVAGWTGFTDTNRRVYVRGSQGSPSTTSCLSVSYFLNTVLADTPRAEWPMADAEDPTYQPNSSWKLSNTNSGANSAKSESAEEDDQGTSEKPSEKEPTQPSSPTSPSSPSQPSTPEPSTPTDPVQPSTPTPSPSPSPTTPDSGGDTAPSA